MSKFVTPYNGKNIKVQQDFELPSLTEQDYKDECDIGYIISNYVRTGQLPATSTISYGDLTSVSDYETAQMIVAECKSNFEQLPASVRDEFKNVQNYLEFISDPQNLKESYERGLINPDSVCIEDVYPERFARPNESTKESATSEIVADSKVETPLQTSINTGIENLQK